MHPRDLGPSSEETVNTTAVSRLVGYVFSAATVAAETRSPSTSAALVSSNSSAKTLSTASGSIVASSIAFPSPTPNSRLSFATSFATSSQLVPAVVAPTTSPTSISSSSPTSPLPSTTSSVHPSIAPISGASTNYGHLYGDRRVAIILASVLGAIAFGFALLIFCCVWRRKRKTGSYLKRPPVPRVSLAPTESEVESWRRPRSSALESIHPATGRADRQFRVSSGGALITPALVPSYPARAKHRSRDSLEEEFPFFNQQHSRVDFARSIRHHPIRGTDLDAYESSTEHLEQPVAPFTDSPRRSSGSSRLALPVFPGADTSQPPSTSHSRPEQPEMAYTGASPRLPSRSPRRAPTAPPPERLPTPPALKLETGVPRMNPFTFDEDIDDEEEDHVSPILTPLFKSKSPEPGHSSAIHYPSWSEVSEFDFGGGERRSRNYRDSSADSAENWRLGQVGRVPDSAAGRHELE